MTESLLDKTTDDQIQIDPNKKYLDTLVGEGGKFHKENRDEALEALARGKFEADQYIEIQNRRMDELRADYMKLREEIDTGASLKDLIDQLSNQQQLNNREIPAANEEEMKPVFDPTQLDSLVSNKIQEYEYRKREQSNLNEVRSKLKEQFGDNHQTILKKQIDELGLSVEDVDALARKSPKAFFKTLGLDRQHNDSFEAPTRSSLRNDNFSPNVPKRTWNYYQKIKKEDPNLYWDAKTQIQMQKDAVALGDEFKDGDWRF